MRTLKDKFHGAMELQPEESFKVFLFIAKALAAIGFIFVFGNVAATGRLTPTLTLVLLLAAAVDLVPELVTVRMLRLIPEQAQRAEKLQLFLKAVSYLILLSIAAGIAASVLWAYTAFVVLWIASFLVEEAVLFLLEDPTSG